MDGIDLKPEDVFRPNWDANISSTRTWVDPNGYRLSDRLWRAGILDRKAIDNTLSMGLARGWSPLETAKQVERYLHPELAPRRDPETFRIKPESQQPQSVQLTRKPRQGPGVGPDRPRNSGLGSYAARRLARTETTQAFGDATKKAAKANVLLERMRWRKSAHHHEPDVCDQNARRSSRNQPPGVYFVDELPRYTAHPHEMCTITPYVTQEDIDFAIPRLREYIRTGNLPDRTWGRTAHGKGTHIPIYPAGQTVAPATVTPEPEPTAAGRYDLTDTDLGRDVDAFRQKLRNSRSWEESEAAVRNAGRLIRRDMRQHLDPDHDEMLMGWGKARMEHERINAEFMRANKKLYSSSRKTFPSDKELARYNDLKTRRDAAYHQEREYALGLQADFGASNPYRDAALTSLRKVRQFGSDKQHDYVFDRSDDVAMSSLHRANEVMPREWWEQSVEAGPIVSRHIKRGFHRAPYGSEPAQINGSGTGDYLDEVMVHEFTHRAQWLRPTIKQAETGFYQRRTEGEKSVPLSRTGKGYSRDEKYKPDEFTDPYIGKDYGERTFEVATMGVQHLLGTRRVPTYLAGDEEYMELILGLLAIG